MQLLVVVLNKDEYLEQVLQGFLEVGVRGATVIDSVGMGRIISYNIPIFAGLRHLFDAERPQNKTIFAVVEDTMVDDAIAMVEEICGSLDEPGAGIAFTVPISHVKGLAEEL